MSIRCTPFRSAVAGLVVAMSAGFPVLADDTEIFVGNVLQSSQPNVLLVLDTSGSMGTIIDTAPAYDAAVSYPGDCRADVMYWEKGSSGLPECGDQWFYVSALKCQVLGTAVASNGFAVDRAARWDAKKEKWNKLDKKANDHMVECGGDFGLHGSGMSETLVYPANKESGPWTSDIADRNVLNWNKQKEYVMAIGNYLNYEAWSNSQATKISRLEMMKRSVLEIVDGTNAINIGLMRFSRNGSGGQVLVPVTPIADARETMRTTVTALAAGGNTPLAETMYEATRYLTGAPPYFGWNSTGNGGVRQPSVASSIADGSYISPIVNECQKNFVVLLTDGEPVGDWQADSLIPDLPGYRTATGQSSCRGNCLDEVAAYMHNHDLNDDLNEDQVADVYTIGFFTDQKLLEDTANRGNGLYYTADNSDELLTAFTEIFQDIDRKDVTFTAPSVSINSFNRLTHRDELYFTMFRPDAGAHWDGNLKRYRLGLDDGDSAILDARNAPAINPATGTFYEAAKSFWTIGDPDGYDTTAGGFSSRLLANRKVFTVSSGATSNVVLDTPQNRVHEDNSAITRAMVSAADATERQTILRWARGVNDNGEVLNILGDALHSQPVIVSYGGSASNPDMALFYTTNDGYFHAVNPMAGASEPLELFSFIPADMLPRLGELAENNGAVPKSYGLDGPMSMWIKGDNGNGIVDSGEKLMLFFGMRRGGTNYYAMDVTDRTDPRLAWVIQGGTGDFAEMGQSWSKMTPARVRFGGSDRDVLFVGGGYDTGQDSAGRSIEDSEGRAIYMVDATTGQRLWWAANANDHATADLPLTEMTHSIPSDLLVVDMDQDSYADRIYVGDMGGKLWRLDFDNHQSTGAADFGYGGVIGDFGGDGAAGNRRFYYPPSVSQVVSEDLGVFLAVAIGSGHRANPLGTSGKFVDDRFYMLRDPHVMRPARDMTTNLPVYSTATEADLMDVTVNLDPSTDQLNGYKGWMIRMGTNEKVLAAPLTADGRIFFTSYVPDVEVQPTCNPTGAAGGGRFYSVLIGTGAPPPVDEPPGGPDDPPDDPPVGGPGDPECNYRCTDTTGPIPPEPVLIFQEPDPDNGDPCDGIADVSLVVGTDIRNPGICTAPVRTFWFSDAE